MSFKTELEREVIKNLKDEKALQERLEAKKERLQQLKQRYSETTDELYASDQNLIRMKNALRQQSKDINKQTKNYVDNCVGLALCEAESAFFSEIQGELSDDLEYEREMAGVVESRDQLVLKLAEYRSCRESFGSTRQEVTGDCNRARQECLDASFYCQDIRTKFTHDLKKAQLSKAQNRSSVGTRVHIKNLSDAISLIADRVLDSREELKGYFKNQMQKMKREQRLMQEAEDLHRLKKRDQDDINGVSTKKDLENFIKSQKLFDAEHKESKDDFASRADSSPDGRYQTGAPSSPRGPPQSPRGAEGRFSPKPPPQSKTMPVNISPRAGNLVHSSARAQRQARTVQWATVNVDNLGDDLVLMCQLEGKKYRLEAMKQMMQTNNLYNIALLQCIKGQLAEDFKSQSKSSNQHEEAGQGGEAPNSAVNGDPPSESVGSRGCRSRSASEDVTSAGPPVSKRKRRVVNAGSALMQGVDDSAIASQYIANGLTYAQSLCSEARAVEKNFQKQRDANLDALASQCSHDLRARSTNKTASTSASVVKAKAQSREIRPLLSEEYDGEDEEESDVVPELPYLPTPPTTAASSPVMNSRKTGIGVPKKSAGGNEKKKIGHGMQSGTVAGMKERKSRDKERERALSSGGVSDSDTDEIRDDVGISHWVNGDKYRNLLVDILVSELNASTDTPVELGLAKVASMCQIAAKEVQGSVSRKEKEGQDSQKNTGLNKPSLPVSKASYASHHRNVQIQGLSSLDIK